MIMYEPQINYLAVLVATLAHYILGALWYSPLLFLKQWTSAMGLSDAEAEELSKSRKGKGLALQFIGTLVLVFVTAHMIDYMKVVHGDFCTSNLSLGLLSAFWLWLGYIATFGLTGVIFEKHSWKLYGINMGFQFVGLMIVGAILAVWL